MRPGSWELAIFSSTSGSAEERVPAGQTDHRFTHRGVIRHRRRDVWILGRCSSVTLILPGTVNNVTELHTSYLGTGDSDRDLARVGYDVELTGAGADDMER